MNSVLSVTFLEPWNRSVDKISMIGILLVEIWWEEIREACMNVPFRFTAGEYHPFLMVK